MGKLKKYGHELMKKRIKEYDGSYITGLLYATVGTNNWRKMHGFPIMRGERHMRERIQNKIFRTPEVKEKKIRKLQEKAYKVAREKYRLYKVRTSKPA